MQFHCPLCSTHRGQAHSKIPAALYWVPAALFPKGFSIHSGCCECPCSLLLRECIGTLSISNTVLSCSFPVTDTAPFWLPASEYCFTITHPFPQSMVDET